MRSHLAAAAAALIVCFASVDFCRASIQNPSDGFNTVKLFNGTGSRGGIFHVDKNPSGPVSIDFDTFCVQTLETMNFDTPYTVYNVSKNTVGAVQHNVALGSFAAWLYSGFLGLSSDMNLASFTTTSAATFNPTTLSHVDALQAGIWRSMGYADSTFGYSMSTFMNNMVSAWYTAFLADTLWATHAPDVNGRITGNISIMNLVTMKSDGTTIKNDYQDQLVYIPPSLSGSPPVVPEPLSFFVWSMLAMCVGMLTIRSRD